MKPVAFVGRLILIGSVAVLVATSICDACNPTGNDPYRCSDRCDEAPDSPLCVAACERWPMMQNCPRDYDSEEGRDLPYSYPCWCFVNPDDDPVYEDDDVTEPAPPGFWEETTKNPESIPDSPPRPEGDRREEISRRDIYANERHV